MSKKKTVLIFSVDALLKPDTKEVIRKDLLRQIEEGVVVTDLTYDYVKTVLPKDAEIQIELVDVEVMNDKN